MKVAQELKDALASAGFTISGADAVRPEYWAQTAVTDREGKLIDTAPVRFTLDFGAQPRLVGKHNVPPPATKFDGLLAYWSFDEGQGDTAADGSGKKNDARLSGTRWVDGVRGKALEINAQDNPCDLGGELGLNFGAMTPFTIAGWLQTGTTTGTVLSFRNSRDGGADLEFFVENGFLEAQVRPDRKEFSSPARPRSKQPISDGGWHHFALVRPADSTTVELYVDGVLQARATTPEAGGSITTDLRAVGAERYWISKGQFGGDKALFRGRVDELCIFGRALPLKEIIALAGREVPEK